MKRLVSLLLALSLVLALTACGSKADGAADAAAGSPPRDSAPAEESAGDPVELIVFAAASMTETLTEIAELYKTAAPKVTITYNFDSSGKLLTQIKEGADCDLFISAAPTQMNALDGSLIGDTEKNPDGLDLIVTDSRIDLLKLDGEPRMAVYVFSTAEERDQGVADWEGYAALALFAEDGLPHLFTEDTCLLIYYGVDEDLLAALSELWQSV